jgi:hypothetical protein
VGEETTLTDLDPVLVGGALDTGETDGAVDLDEMVGDEEETDGVRDTCAVGVAWTVGS